LQDKQVVSGQLVRISFAKVEVDAIGFLPLLGQGQYCREPLWELQPLTSVLRLRDFCDDLPPLLLLNILTD